MAHGTKTSRYLAIAAKYLPEGVIVAPLLNIGASYQGRSYLYNGVMEVPIPNTIGRLWVYLHECAHMRFHRHVNKKRNTYSRLEAEADLEVMRILDEEAVRIPYRTLETQYLIFLYVVLEDDKTSERHPIASDCLKEYKGRMVRAAITSQGMMLE